MLILGRGNLQLCLSARKDYLRSSVNGFDVPIFWHIVAVNAKVVCHCKAV